MRRVLYGREEVLRTVTGALREPGALVTLTGLPGSGRTSLAKAAIGTLEADPPGASVVEVRRTLSHKALITALRAAASSPVTVVDDVDHVPYTRNAVLDLRRSQPLRKLLLTSATRLGLAGEVVVRLPPLPLPDPDDDPDVLRGHPAVRLFLEVAARTGTTAGMEDTALAHIARICRHLGGLPLAISLAAARTATYSPASLLDLLIRDPVRLLRGHGRDLHHALKLRIAMISGDQRDLLEDLTVFHGPVGIEAVEQVCARPDVVDALPPLVDVHLVEPHHDGRGSRFSLPPLVRGYLTRASTTAPDPDLRRRHLRWTCSLAEEAVDLAHAGRSMAARELVAPLEDDFAAALSEAVEEGDRSSATSVLLALLPLWFSRGAIPEAIRTIGTVLRLHTGNLHREDPVDHLVLRAWHELLRTEATESVGTVERAVATLVEIRSRARGIGDTAFLEVTCLAILGTRYLDGRSVPEAWVAEGRELAERLARPDVATDVAWGAHLSPADAVDAVLGYAAQVRRSACTRPVPQPKGAQPPRPVPVNRTDTGTGLTNREHDVLELLATGGTNREISEALGISAKTVMHHASAIYRKLGVRGRAEAVARYLRAGPPGPAARPLGRLHLVVPDEHRLPERWRGERDA